MTIPLIPGRVVRSPHNATIAEDLVDPGASPIGKVLSLVDDGLGNPISAWADPSIIAGGMTGQRLRKNSNTDYDVVWVWDDYVIPLIIDGGGNEITTGFKGFLHVVSAGTIIGATLIECFDGNPGSIVIDVWKGTYASLPTVANSICAAAKPTISAGIKSQDNVLPGWTVAVAAGDVLGFNVDSCTDIERVLLSLTVRKT